MNPSFPALGVQSFCFRGFPDKREVIRLVREYELKGCVEVLRAAVR